MCYFKKKCLLLNYQKRLESLSVRLNARDEVFSFLEKISRTLLCHWLHFFQEGTTFSPYFHVSFFSFFMQESTSKHNQQIEIEAFFLQEVFLFLVFHTHTHSLSLSLSLSYTHKHNRRTQRKVDLRTRDLKYTTHSHHPQ